MSDRVAVGVAALLAVAAWCAVPTPLVVGLVSMAAGILTAALSSRWGPTTPPPPASVVLLVLGVALVVSGRASDATSALVLPPPAFVEGTATLVSDPERQRFGTSALVSIDGRRYAASAADPAAREMRTLMSGDRIVIRGRTGDLEGAPRSWVLSRHLAGRLTITSLETGPPAPVVMRAANAVRRTVAAGAASFDDDDRPIYLGMVVGDDRGQASLTEFRFRVSGLTHVLVVSGQNVAFLLVVAAPLRRHLPRRARIVTGLGLLTMFVLVTRADPSVLRAAVMAGIVILVVESGRVAPAVRVLAMAVVVLVIADPLIVRSLGFQLSVAATSGLLVGTVFIADRLRGPEPLRVATAVTIAAQVATAPLLLMSMGWLSPSAVLTNLLAGPAAGAVMMLGATVGLLSGMLHESLAAPLMWPARVGVWWVDVVASMGARLPLAALEPWRCAVLVGCGVFVATAMRLARPPARRWLCVVALVPAAAALIATAPAPGIHDPTRGVQLVVGDCGGSALVVDGASGNEVDALEAVWRTGLRSVDVVAVGAGRNDQRLGHSLAAQFGAREVLGDVARELVVGGVRVSVSAEGVAEADRDSCTVGR